MSSSTYRPNPFFATSSAFFVPSVGETIDKATAQAQAKFTELKAQAIETAGDVKEQAYLRTQDLKETAKDSVSTAPTGIDLYSRCVID